MINRGDYSKKLEGLKAKDLGKANSGAFTVERVEEMDITDPRTEEVRKALAVHFEEFPDKPWWPNGTSIGIICDVYTENEKKWIGKLIPIEKVKANNPQTGKAQESLWVAAADEWDDFPGMNGRKHGRPAARKTAKRVAKKTR